MANIKVKFKMTPEQYLDLRFEYLNYLNDNAEYITFNSWLDKKYSDLIDKKIVKELYNAK